MMPHAIMSSFRKTKLAIDDIKTIMDMLVKNVSVDSTFREVLEDATFDISQNDDETCLNFDFAPTVNSDDMCINKMSYDLNNIMGTFSVEKKLSLSKKMIWNRDKFSVSMSFNHAGPEFDNPEKLVEVNTEATTNETPKLTKKGEKK
ncbi:MAG: hypothetical protein ACTSXE_02535 [Candidatus Thorarchaeota archaeon]